MKVWLATKQAQLRKKIEGMARKERIRVESVSAKSLRSTGADIKETDAERSAAILRFYDVCKRASRKIGPVGCFL